MCLSDGMLRNNILDIFFCLSIFNSAKSIAVLLRKTIQKKEYFMVGGKTEIWVIFKH